jgi:hypothetical protein
MGDCPKEAPNLLTLAQAGAGAQDSCGSCGEAPPKGFLGRRATSQGKRHRSEETVAGTYGTADIHLQGGERDRSAGLGQDCALMAHRDREQLNAA